MPHLLRGICATLFALLPLTAATTLTVSPTGPLTTLAAARDEARALHKTRPAEPITIQVKAGVYRLSEPMTLTSEDSNTTFAAAPGEHPLISGGKTIDGWKKLKGAIWTAPATGDFHQLFVNGRRAQRARAPNHGYYRIDGPSSQDKPFLLHYRGNEIRKSWADAGDVEVIALLAWAEIRMPIREVDESAHTAKLAGNPRPSNKEVDARYYVENAPDALDISGEWYLDKKAGAVNYWPVAGENLAADEVVVPAIQRLVQIDGAKNVTFRGLDFRHTDWTIGPNGYADSQAAVEASAALEAVNSDHISIEKCRFSQLGGYAIWLGKGSKHGRIVGNQIFDMGAGGVKIGETTRRPTDGTAEADLNYENDISDNEIRNLGIVYPAAIGIWVAQSSRNTIAHNDVHDLFYTAISIGWTWGYAPNPCNHNIVEFNHLYNIGKGMMSDMGAIYTLGLQPGTIIRNNLIHDVTSFTYGGWGIYPDEGTSDMLIENNIVYRTKSAGFHQHYGANNTVRNNIFALGSEYQIMRTRAEDHLSFTFERNIIYYESGRVFGSNWTGDQYKMKNNLYWDARGNPVHLTPHDEGAVIADPLFAAPAAGNFKLAPNSPAWKLGWKAIDMSTVGPR